MFEYIQRLGINNIVFNNIIVHISTHNIIIYWFCMSGSGGYWKTWERLALIFSGRGGCPSGGICWATNGFCDLRSTIYDDEDEIL